MINKESPRIIPGAFVRFIVKGPVYLTSTIFLTSVKSPAVKR